jgi:hypothetical protein
LSGYLERGTDLPKPIATQHLISDATTIFQLVTMFDRRIFYFVLSADEIAGYVHYSDLNSPIVKLPYFVLLQEVEWLLLNRVTPHITEAMLREVASPDRVERILEGWNKAQVGDVDRGWAGLLHFSEIVHLACRAGVIVLDEAERRVIGEYRNRVCHADRRLIDEHWHVSELRRANEVCSTILAQFRSESEA